MSIKPKIEKIDYDVWKYELDNHKEYVKDCPEDRDISVDELKDFIWYCIGEQRWLEYNKKGF